jgi:hypothetical protein
MTSPDPDLNRDSRDYFTRHMRILEKVMAAWPMPELQKQIDAVREAFSADLRRPFVLKPSFPYGSPASSHSTPPRSSPGYRPMLDQAGPLGMGQPPQVEYPHQPISPPISTGTLDSKTEQALAMMTTGQGLPGTISVSDPPAWNPARIFEWVHPRAGQCCSG